MTVHNSINDGDIPPGALFTIVSYVIRIPSILVLVLFPFAKAKGYFHFPSTLKLADRPDPSDTVRP